MDNLVNKEFDLYRDIQMRTGGEIYIGVIGPVRTGKSTFIKRLMDLLVLPNLPDGPEKMRILDEMPQSGTGRTITTTEPKFLPKDAFSLNLSEDLCLKLRLIDCVGYMINGAAGHMEDEKPRLVKTPWFEEKIPFVKAAEIGTKKVMQEHSTIGIVVTCDGSFSDLPRENYLDAEKRTIEEMKNSGKPFVVILNSSRPYGENALQIQKSLEEEYRVPVLALNCEQLKQNDIKNIFENILKEFPITDMEFYMPEWVEMLSDDTEIKRDIFGYIKDITEKINRVQDVMPENMLSDSIYISKVKIDSLNLSNGRVKIYLEIDETYYYDILSKMTGENIAGEYDLLSMIQSLSQMKKEYVKVQDAIDAVRQKGYGVVMPVKEEIALETPVVVKHGNRYGVNIKATAPSIHLIKANIETEISPIIGNESQAEDLMNYIAQTKNENGNIWETNIFGKSIEELVEDGVKSKVYQIGEESQIKLQETMQKIVNDSSGGMVCIII